MCSVCVAKNKLRYVYAKSLLEWYCMLLAVSRKAVFHCSQVSYLCPYFIPPWKIPTLKRPHTETTHFLVYLYSLA